MVFSQRNQLNGYSSSLADIRRAAVKFMVKECILSTGKLPPEGLPRNSVVRITDRPDMTSAVYH